MFFHLYFYGKIRAPLLEVDEIQYIYQSRQVIDDGDIDNFNCKFLKVSNIGIP